MQHPYSDWPLTTFTSFSSNCSSTMHTCCCSPALLMLPCLCAVLLPPFPAGEVLAPLVSVLPLEVRPALEGFISRCLTVFGDLDATLLEMNPFTLEPASGQVGGVTRPSRGEES